MSDTSHNRALDNFVIISAVIFAGLFVVGSAALAISIAVWLWQATTWFAPLVIIVATDEFPNSIQNTIGYTNSKTCTLPATTQTAVNSAISKDLNLYSGITDSEVSISGLRIVVEPKAKDVHLDKCNVGPGSGVFTAPPSG